MGIPVFRFTLSHQQAGTKVISEPDGWKDAKLKLERHPDYHSLVEYFEGDFIFYGSNGVVDGGINFIKNVENQYGPDAKINISIDLSWDEVDYENIFTGLLDLYGLQEVKDNKLSCPVKRDDFWSNFIARKETPVNLTGTTDLDGNTRSVLDVIDINLPSQKIQKRYNSGLVDSFVVVEADWSTSDYIQLGVNERILDEIEESFTIPSAQNPEIPVWQFAMEDAGDYTFDLRIEASNIYYTCSGAPSYVAVRNVDVCHAKLNFLLQKNDETALFFVKTNNPASVDKSTVYTFTETLSLNKGDTIRIYGDIIATITEGDTANIVFYSKTNEFTVKTVVYIAGTCTPAFIQDEFINYGTSPQGAGLEYPTYFKITANTIYPSNETQGYLLHDAANAITDKIIGRDNTFYSEYIGSTLTNGRSYASDGCGWPLAIVQGLQLRGYSITDKQIFMSFDKWWRGVNPVLNLGLGYDTISGQPVIRCEKKSDFYIKTSTSVNFDNVREITREYDNGTIIKKIDIGYNKWQSEDISGIDDPQTKRTFATILKGGSDLTLHSDFIAASLAIETTRRQTIEKSKDYKYDNDIFIIHLSTDDVSPDRYRPALDEYFDSVTGLLNYETRYNLLLTPTRNLFRWLNYIYGGLTKYPTSSLKFVSGEGNYSMSSDFACSLSPDDGCLAVFCDLFSEGGDLPLSAYGPAVGYLHLPDLFNIEIDLSWEDYSIIRSNRNKAIGISQTSSGHKKFFIKDLEYQICHSKCKMTLWAAEPFQMQVI